MSLKIEKRGGTTHKPKTNHPWHSPHQFEDRRSTEDRQLSSYNFSIKQSSAWTPEYKGRRKAGEIGVI